MSGLIVQYNLISFWIFSLAEPNATLIAACVPVLRVMFRDAKTTYYRSKSPSTGGYVKQNNHSSGAFACRERRGNYRCKDAQSEQSNVGGGITRTREVVVGIEGDRGFEMRDQVPFQK